MTNFTLSLNKQLWLNSHVASDCANQSDKPTMSVRFENYGIGREGPWKL